MENIMTCPPTRDSIAKEVEICEESAIDIPPEWPECCIYRIPKQLRMVKVEAYTPKLLSIGPFHYKADELKDMEKHKQRYLKHFLKRTQKSEEDLRKIIEDKEEEIRHSYSEDYGLGSDDFVKMILLDAIFIIELFLKDKEEKEAKRKEEKEAKRKEEEDCKKESDYIFSKPWLRDGILHDLILLENQLPFFVLEELYMFALGEEEGQQIKEHKLEDLKKEDSPLFVKLSRNCFGCLSHHQEGQQIKEHKEDTPFVELSRKYFRRYDKEPKPIDEEVKVKHLTDLLRYLFLPSGMKYLRSEEQSLDTRICATKLDDAGLKFEVKRDRRLLDISVHECTCFDFSCCIACLPCFICLILCFPCLLRVQRRLEVQQLVIDYDTETIFRNLMALEQCHYPFQTYICNYVDLLDRLIDTDKDVDLLVHKKIIHNLLGSNADTASLINKLRDQIVETPSFYFNYIHKKIYGHYELALNRTMATLKREYFPNIFRGTATVVGLIVLGFTLWNFLRPFVV